MFGILTLDLIYGWLPFSLILIIFHDVEVCVQKLFSVI